MSDAFANRVALVTGGSRGIGRATALRLAREGADVAISYASRSNEAEQVVAEIQALGRKAICCRLQCRPAGRRELVWSRRRESTWGRSTCLPTAVRSAISATIPSLSYELWLETIDVNLNGAFLVVFAVKDEMIARGFGRIVLISSVAALRPRKMQIHYASSKAGVIALTRCCGEAFAPHNVRVNCVAPGLIETEMAHVLPDEIDEAHRGRHAAGPDRPARRDRLGDPLPAERGIELHDRRNALRQRRTGHAALNGE